MSNSMSNSDIDAQASAVFNLLADDMAGTLSAQQLTNSFIALGLDVKQSDIKKLIARIRRSLREKNLDSLSWEAFRSYASDALSRRNEDAEILRMFELFAGFCHQKNEGSGSSPSPKKRTRREGQSDSQSPKESISLEDLRACGRSLGYEVSDASHEKMIRFACSLEQSGAKGQAKRNVVGFEEFRRMMML